jgi:hypothetical protein
MKLLFITLFAIISFTTFAQPWSKVEGNGNITKEVREVGNFTAIASGGSWDVVISYNTDKTVVIEADENLIQYIKTEVEGGKLIIKSEKNINLKSSHKMKIYVSLTKITGLSMAGSGNMTGTGNFTNDGKTSFSLAGSGNINLDFKSIEKVAISIAGSGNINLKGTSNEVAVSIAGSGNANCEGLVANDVKVSVAGSGKVKVNSNTSLKVSIMGSGNVYYTGATTKISKNVSGSGKVVRQ